MDPLEFRRRNLISGYYEDAYLKPIAANTNGIFQCLEKGAEYIHWDEKRKEYADQTGYIRRGVGVSVFSYKTGVWPISLEIAGCRLSLNQDGSVQMQIGATEDRTGRRHCIFSDGCRNPSYGRRKYPYYDRTGYGRNAF